MASLNAIVDVSSLRSALAALGRVAPNRFLSHALLSVDADDSAALSVAVNGARLRVPIPFTRALTPGSVMLPLDRVPSLLKLTKGITADVESLEGPIVRIRTSEPKSGLSATYNLATVATSAEESTGPVFADDASLWIIPANELLLALDRVKHAIGDSTRYSLGGALIEIPSYGHAMALVATDTRRLARQTFRGSLCGSGVLPFGPESGTGLYHPILPESAFKVLSGLLKSGSGPDVGLSFAEMPPVNPNVDPEPTRWARFVFGESDGPELVVRLAEGKFPKWEQVRPDEHALDSSAQVKPAELGRAVTSARIGTTDDAPGIRLESIGSGNSGALRLSAGGSSVEVYADGVRGKFGITLGARYVADIVKALGKSSEPIVIRGTTSLDSSGGSMAATFSTPDGFTAFMMPIVAPVPVAEPEPTAEEIGAAEMSSHWPLSLEPGDVAVWTGIRSGEGSTGRWHVVGPHPDGPGLYVARPETAWGALGEPTCIDPRGPEWSLQVSADDDDESNPAPIASPDAPDPRTVKVTADRILMMPYGTSETMDAADRWTNRYYRAWNRRPEGSDVHGSLFHRVWSTLTISDTFAMARRRYYARQDAIASRASVDPWHVEIPAPEPISSPEPEPSDPTPAVGNPLLQAILDTTVPKPRRADLRREPRKVWAKAVRSLFRDLGLTGISVRAPRYSQASSIDITIPGQVAHETSPMRGHDYGKCPLCQQEHAAERHIERLIVGAFPDLDDRSEYGTDYFDNPLSIHTGSPIPVASDPEPLPVASPGIGYPAPAMIYPLQPIILLDDPEPLSDPEPYIPDPSCVYGHQGGSETCTPEPLITPLPHLGTHAIERPHDEVKVGDRIFVCYGIIRVVGIERTDERTTFHPDTENPTVGIHRSQWVAVVIEPEPIAPEPEPFPVASVRGIPITFGRSVPRVAPEPMARTRNGITLREPEPIGHPDNTTIADAGAPAIGLAALVVECHGHTEPLSVLDTGVAPVASWPIMGAIQELSDVAPSPDPEPLDTPDPSRSGRRVGLTLAESIDHEADRLEARRNGAGRLMARALRELAESVRWSGATTPDEHESRMQLWEEWAVDNEPRESMTSY